MMTQESKQLWPTSRMTPDPPLNVKILNVLLHIFSPRTLSKKRNATPKYTSANILDNTVQMGKGNQKSGIKKSGVHLRYHKPGEYDKLSKPQQKEQWGSKCEKETRSLESKKVAYTSGIINLMSTMSSRSLNKRNSGSIESKITSLGGQQTCP